MVANICPLCKTHWDKVDRLLLSLAYTFFRIYSVRGRTVIKELRCWYFHCKPKRKQYMFSFVSLVFFGCCGGKGIEGESLRCFGFFACFGV